MNLTLKALCVVTMGGALFALHSQLADAGKTPRAAATSPTAPSDPVDDRAPLLFVENRGQTDRRVAYYADVPATTFYLGESGVTIALKPKGLQQGQIVRASAGSLDRSDDTTGPEGGAAGWAVQLQFVGARAAPHGEQPTRSIVNYLKGPREGWKRSIPTFGEVVYPNLWPGIHLRFTGSTDALKYTFIADPGADPSRIQLAYRGVSSIVLNGAGELELATPHGPLKDSRPYAYQEIDGRRVTVDVSFSLERSPERDTAAFGFDLESYDRAVPLVIDPAVLVFSGYLGGSSEDSGSGIDVDGNGDTYVVGYTASLDFPVLPGAFDATGSASGDAFVSKIQAGSPVFAYSTYLGGSSLDNANAVVVDAFGHAYVTGETLSSDFPVTPGAVGQSCTANCDSADVFVSKLNEFGTDLLYSTFLGGSSRDAALGIDLDPFNNAFVTGTTASTDFPIKSAIQQDQPQEDAFVAALNGNGSDLLYSTYVGGNGKEDGWAIAVDAIGNAWITGQTSSSDFPLANPFQGDQPGVDAFVTKVSWDGKIYMLSTYLGGNAAIDDIGQDITVDTFESAYVTGRTSSTDFPTTPGAFDTTCGTDGTCDGGITQGWLMKFNSLGNVVYSTYLNDGDGFAASNAVAADDCGKAYVHGTTFATDFPTKRAIMGNHPDQDTFVSKFNAAGSKLIYSTYLGGDGFDDATGADIAVDAACSRVYATGSTNSSDLPAVGTTALSATLTGTSDAYVARIDSPGADLMLIKAGAPDPVQVGGVLNYGLIVRNCGSKTAKNVVLKDRLPRQVELIDIMVPEGNCGTNNRLVECRWDELPCGETVRVMIRVRANGVVDDIEITNLARVRSDTSDPDKSDNKVRTSTVVVP